MIRLLLLLLGTVSARMPAQREAAWFRPEDRRPGEAYPRDAHRPGKGGRAGDRYGPADVCGQEDAEPPGDPWAQPAYWDADARPARRVSTRPMRPGAGTGGGRPRRLVPRWVRWTAIAAVAGLIFRRAVASVALTAVAAGLHLVGITAHLPSVRFAWPWQTISAGTATNADLGPWVLQKIEGISRPALGRANFTFYFTHKVSKSIGPWPCWYASTFFAVARASATVDLNPGPAWWKPSSGHYELRVLSRPAAGKPGHVTVTMALPQAQLPQSAHDVTVDNLPSRPIATQHSWTYPGLGCGVVLRPQFPQSVLYAEAQRIAFGKSQHAAAVTGPLVRTAEAEAVQTIRDNFVQPTLNEVGYDLDRFTIRWLPADA